MFGGRFWAHEPPPPAAIGFFTRLSVPIPEDIGVSGAADHSAALEFGRFANARLAKAEKTENSPEPWSGHGNARHEQLLHPLKLEAGVARLLVDSTRGTLLFQTATFNMAPS